jgi:pimeloyl-ACP methyl ester carboxylesterase
MVVNFDYGPGAADPEVRSALDQADDVLAVMDALAIETGCVVGSSRGAMTAFSFAASHAERVSALVLALPVAGYRDTLGIQGSQPEPGPDEDEASFLRRMVETVFSLEFLVSNFDDAVAVATSPPGEVMRAERSEEEPFPERLTVTSPTLVIEGGADQIVTAEHPARYLSALPDAEHVEVPGASHGWAMERPADCARILDDFFRSL